MFQSLNPGVHVRRVEIAPALPTRIDVAAFIGIAARGPLNRVEVVEGWAEFVSRYGDFQSNAFLAYAVRGFFDNGGLRCHVLRIAAPALETRTTGPQPADGASSVLAEAGRVRAGAVATLVQSSLTVTAGAQPADRRRSLVAATAGMVAGNAALVQQPGRRPARRQIATVDAAAGSLGWTVPLPADFDLAQPIAITCVVRDERLVAGVAGATVTWTRPLDGRFDLAHPLHVGFGAAVAGAVVGDETGDPLLSIEAADPGRWGNALSVRVTTRNGGGYTTRTLSRPDPADRLSLDRVDGLAVGALVEASQDAAGPVRARIASLSSSDLAITLVPPLVGFDLVAAANGAKPIVARRLSATLSVREAGRLVEIHEDIDLPPPEAPDQSRVNDRSRLIRIARMPGPGDRWLDADGPMLTAGEVRLGGGRDGIAMLQPSDITGATGMAPAGLGLFADRSEPAALAIPDLRLPAIPARETLVEDPPDPDPCALCPAPPNGAHAALPDVLSEATPGFPEASVLDVQRAMIEQCETLADRVALLDPPLSAGGGCPDWPDLMTWRQQFDSSFGAAYHPWIDVADPLDAGGRLTRRIPASGHALGQFALADREPGHAAPANRPLQWTAGTACDLDDTRHGALNDRGLNAITLRAGRGIRIMGARTLSSHSDWEQLTVRRLMIRLRRSIRRDLAWAVFEPANRAFEQRVIATLEGLMELEWQAGRLRGRQLSDAFRIAIDRDAASSDDGQFVVLLAVAPALPAEFMFLRLAFSLDAMDLAELTASGGWPT